MPGSYTADEQSAAKMMAAIADSPTALAVGVVTKTTSSTTARITHGVGGTPDFVIASIQADGGTTPLNALAVTTTSTLVTFTITTAQTNWSVAYIVGYTA